MNQLISILLFWVSFFGFSLAQASDGLSSCTEIPPELVIEVPAFERFLNMESHNLLYAHSSIYNASREFRKTIKVWNKRLLKEGPGYCFDGILLGKSAMKYDILLMNHKQLEGSGEIHTLWHTGSIQAKEGGIKKVNPILSSEKVKGLISNLQKKFTFPKSTPQQEDAKELLSLTLRDQKEIALYSLSESSETHNFLISWHEVTGRSADIYSVHYIPRGIFVEYNFVSKNIRISQPLSIFDLLQDFSELVIK